MKGMKPVILFENIPESKPKAILEVQIEISDMISCFNFVAQTAPFCHMRTLWRGR